MKTKKTTKIKEEYAAINPSYDKSLPIKARLGDFLGKYHILLNGVVAHDPFMLTNEGKPNERCDTSHKLEIIEFIDSALKAQEKQLRKGHEILVNTILKTKKAELKAQREETLKEVEKWVERQRENYFPDAYHFRNVLIQFLDKLNKKK